jgi:hypothetical protein
MNYFGKSRENQEEVRGSLENAVLKVAAIKAKLELLKQGDCGEEVIQALELYKQKKEAKEEKKEAESNYWNASNNVRREEANFAPAKRNLRGGKRSKTQKIKRSKKSRKC